MTTCCLQLRSRDPDTKEASMSEYKYDQVDDKLAAELAKQGALSAAAVAAAAATGLSADLYSGPLSLQDYVTLTQGTDSDNNSSSSSTTDSSTNDSSSSSGMTQQAAGMSPADVEAGVWAERVKGMSEKEALQVGSAGSCNSMYSLTSMTLSINCTVFCVLILLAFDQKTFAYQGVNGGYA